MDTKPPLWLFCSVSPQFACLFRSNALIAKLCHATAVFSNGKCSLETNLRVQVLFWNQICART